MWICQQPQFNACAPTIDVGSDPILSNSELFALLELVIPGDEPLTPIDRQPTTALSSNEFLALLNLVVPGNDASLTAVDMELPTYDFTRHSWEPEFEPGTSFLRPEPAFDAVDSGAMLTIAQPCKLVTPVEIFQGPFVPIVQDGQWCTKPSDKCIVPDCKTKKLSRGRCMRHGGGKRCGAFGCTNGAQTRGLCKRHGGGARCTVQFCNKSSQSGGLCRTHGGGRLCIAPGCKKGAQRQGKCAMHSSRQCLVDGCFSVERGGGFCGRHKHLKQQ